MCGRYALVEIDGIQARFGIDQVLPDLAPRYNVAPTQTLPVVVHNSPNRIVPMRWGLIPAWAKDASSAARMINARAETVAEKPAFRSALRTRRCLVPASGFYEWQRAGTRRTPFYFHLPNAPLFAFAGLYERWRNPDGETIVSYTIITTEANDVVAPVHDRMPVILHREDEDRWLDPAVTNAGAVVPLLHPYPAEEMAAYPVSTTVNSPAHDTPDVREAISV